MRSKAFLIKINQIKSTKNEIVLIFFPQCVLCASQKDERLNYYCIALQFGTLLGAFCCPVPQDRAYLINKLIKQREQIYHLQL